MTANKPRGAAKRILALAPGLGGMSDVAMANRAGFKEARGLAAEIAFEVDAINAELLSAVKYARRYWRERTDADSELLDAAIAKATP